MISVVGLIIILILIIAIIYHCIVLRKWMIKNRQENEKLVYILCTLDIMYSQLFFVGWFLFLLNFFFSIFLPTSDDDDDERYTFPIELLSHLQETNQPQVCSTLDFIKNC